MAAHFISEIERLKRHLLELSAMVEETVNLSVKAIVNDDPELAGGVEDKDRQVDQREVDIEEECLKILALYQPVATDLRFVIAVLKINNDLERISDLAAHIAERAISLGKLDQSGCPPLDFDSMADRVKTMLRRSIDALVSVNSDKAREVCGMDDEVDRMKTRINGRIKRALVGCPDKDSVEALLQLLSVSRHLERIADHATNIAEDLIYMIEGRIVRHTPEVLTGYR